jgi:predicted choloylglycine hydrolase
MLRRCCAIPVLLSLAWGVVAAPAPAADPFRYPEKKLEGKAELKYVQKQIPVLVVEGTPEEIGKQVALLAAKPGQKVFDYPQDYLKRFHLQLFWPMLLRQSEEMLKHFPPDYRKELDALIKASGIDRERVVAGNTMFDIKKFFACSALVVEAERSATRGPLLGRNLDYPSLGYIEQYSLVTVYRPRGKHAFASVGFPGVIGCLSGMNDAGLALGVLEVFQVKDSREKFDASGTPYALCYRRLLEECATVDEAEKLLRAMKRTTTTNLVVCDKKGGAVFEVTAKHVVRRPPSGGFCPCTNHFCTPTLRPGRVRDVSHTLERYQALEKPGKLPRNQRLGVADVHKQLHAVNLGRLTLQTMVFEPAALRLHLAIGSCPASAREFRVVELGPLFKNGPAKE